MTQRDLFAGDIRDKPVWRLTAEEIDTLSKQEQQWVRGHLHDMKEDGRLAMFLANQPGTIYHTVYERGAGWKLEPLVGVLGETAPTARLDKQEG